MFRQPINQKVTKTETSAGARHIPCYVSPFQRTEALLEMETVPILQMGTCLRQRYLNFGRLEAIAAGGILSHQATCRLLKGFCLESFLGRGPRNVGITLVDGCCDIGGRNSLAEGHHDQNKRDVPLLNYTLQFALQLKKVFETTLCQCSRVVRILDCSL